MAFDTNSRVKEFEKRHRERRAWRKVLCALGCVVVFCTTYALILPAITEEHATHCGLGEHTHTDECYEPVLTCPLGEGEGHTHSDACYETQRVLACGLEESDGHVHDESCTRTERRLACTEDHEHTDACYETVTTIVCGLAGGEGAHTHSDDCYAEQQILICGQEENHIHSEACYEQTLVCPLEEHTHSLACYSDPGADVETAADWEAALAGVELTGNYAGDLLAVAGTQLGYRESEKNYIVLDDGETVRGYTRYGAWYGTPYADWCAAFVSFCLHYAGVPTEAFPQSAGCESWAAMLEERGLYQSAAEYLSEEAGGPREGDLVFLDTDGDGAADHVGIVHERIFADDGETITGFTAIEGNSGNQVQKVRYDLAGANILGFGRLPQGSWKSLTGEGEDYSITVNYSAAAALPEDVRLEVREILPGTEEYETYAARAAEAMGEEEGAVIRRFFDLTLLSGDSEVEPAAPVKVDVSFQDRPAAAEETVLHFPENSGEVEVLTATVDEDGLHYEQGSFSVVGFTTSPIDTKLTYAIVSTNTGNGHAMTISESTDRRGNLSVSPSTEAFTSTDTISADLIRWRFVEYGSGYRIYTTSSNGTTYYISNTGGTLSMTSTASDATTFTWDSTNNRLRYTVTGWYGTTTTYYLTIGTNVSGSNSQSSIYLYYDDSDHKVATISPSSTVINLFDYRVNMNAANWKEDGYTAGTGINASAYALKFGNVSSASLGDANKWTGSGAGVLQGIVEKNLGSDGYPVLSKTASFNGSININDSLSYLFDPQNLYLDEAKTQQIKQVYPNVKGLLQLGSDGYYYYDSTKNYAEFPIDLNTRASTNNNRFNVYDEARIQQSTGADKGQFFPFDAYADVTPTTVSGGNGLDHFFGLSLTTYFVQNYNGYADANHKTNTTFEFSGDDDVWIFIDDVLVADLGGIHDAASVKIDFAAGTVTISKVYGQTGTDIETKFSDIFSGTNVELATYDGNTTLVNNSSHTLDFFYLERGGNSSNLSLKYNLLEIPATSIYKVDQYGDTLAGAEFAVYGATKQENGDYLYNATNAAGTAVTVSLKDYTYWDETGAEPTTSYWKYRGTADSGDKWDILVYGANDTLTATIPCKYHGVTDGNGEMVFQSADGSLYSLDDLADDVIGSHFFILREVDVPDGYRTVSDESWFRIDEDAGVMLCDSTYTSGVWASNNANVTASNTLYAAAAYGDIAKTMGFAVADGNTHYSFSDYMSINNDTNTITMNGTLFAVVLKRNDKTLEELEGWYPVYGSDNAGYQLVANDEDSKDLTGIAAVINAARKQEKLTGTGSATFTPSTLGGGVTAQVVLENLPGKIDRYYTYMQQTHGGNLLTGIDANGDPQYFVAYYYTSASSLDTATAANTVRVYSRENVIGDTGYEAFDIAWGTTIEVPNMENRLFFQKRDEGKSTSRTAGLLNGAVFALYPAIDAPTKDNTNINIIYYVGDDGNGNTVYIGMYPSGSANYGKAAVFTKTARLGDGTYEIEKDGIDFNDTNGLVNNEAKTAGVITVTLTDPVAGIGTQGAKYYIRPVKNAAGEIMVGVTHTTCDYANEPGTGHFTKLPEGEYLLREIKAPSGYEENPTDIPVLVNELGVYANAGVNGDKVAVGNGIGFLSKTIDVFASLNEIDESLAWVYGALLRSDATGFTAFDDVTHDVIRVAGTNWKFVKQKTDEAGNVLDPAGYGSDVVVEDDRSQAMVIYYEYNGDLSDSGKHVIFDYTPNDDTGGQAARAAAGEKGVATQAGQTYNGTLLYRLWTTEGWSDLAIYQDYAYGIRQSTTTATTNYDDLTGYGNLSNLFSSSTFVQVTDTRSAVNLDVKKVAAETDENGTEIPLSGAQFRIRRETTVTDVNENGETVEETLKAWYRRDTETDSTVWEPNEAEVTPVTTGADGLAHFYDLAPTSTVRYFLEEYKAPAGYISVGEIEFRVTQEGSTEAGYMPTMTMVTEGYTLSGPGDSSGTRVYTLTVPNATDYELPETGGAGTRAVMAAGLALAALGCGGLAWRRKRGGAA